MHPNTKFQQSSSLICEIEIGFAVFGAMFIRILKCLVAGNCLF